ALEESRSGDHARGTDRNALRLKEGLSARIGDGSATVKQVWMIGESGIEFSERGQALFGHLLRIEITQGGDELPGGNGLGLGLEHGLNVGDGRRGLQADIVAGAHAEQHDVIVIIDQAGNGGTAAKVDGPRARTCAGIAVFADRGELSVLDDRLGYDSVLLVQRVDLAVGQAKIARARAGILLSACTARHEDATEQNRWEPGHGILPLFYAESGRATRRPVWAARLRM